MHFFLKYGSNFLFYILRSNIFFTLHPTKSMKKTVCNFTLGHVLWRFTLITSWLHGKQIWLKIPWHWSVKRAWHPKLISVPDLRNCETTKKNKQKPVTLAEIYTLCKTYQMPYFETSAHTGFGVDECFYEAVSMLKTSFTIFVFWYLAPWKFEV